MEFQTSIKNKLSSICRDHKVRELYLFGSQAKQTATNESDVDILVRFENMDIDYFDNYLGLKHHLEKLFNRTVDLIEDQAIRNPVFRKVVDREKKILYGGETH